MNSDETGPIRIRDFLYVDVDRTRGLLAQIEGGVVDQVVERWKSARRTRFGGRLLGLEAGRDWLTDSDVEHQRTMDDALLGVFEEAAQQTGLLVDIPGITDTDRWSEGDIHRRVRPGQLLRVTGPTQVLDPPHVREEMERTLAVIEGVARFQEATDPTPQPATPPSTGGRKQRRPTGEEWTEAVVARRVEAMLGTPFVSVAAIAYVIERLLGAGIVVRVYPSGVDSPDNVLVGNLTDRVGYLRDDRTALFAKYGWSPSEWTVLSQIATVPCPPEPLHGRGETTSSSEPEDQPADAELGADGSSDATSGEESRPSRAEIEGLAVSFMGVLAETGLTDVPRFPGITMTPLAIYRDVTGPAPT